MLLLLSDNQPSLTSPFPLPTSYFFETTLNSGGGVGSSAYSHGFRFLSDGFVFLGRLFV